MGELRIIDQVALTVPACRTLRLSVWAWKEASPDGGGGGEVVLTGWRSDPVLAIEVTVGRCYESGWQQQQLDPPVRSRSHRDLIRAGWFYEGQFRQVSAIVVDHEDGSLDSTGEVWMEPSDNEVCQIVPCPWPTEEDERRLEPLIAEMTVEAKRKREWKEEARRRQQQQQRQREEEKKKGGSPGNAEHR